IRTACTYSIPTLRVLIAIVPASRADPAPGDTRREPATHSANVRLRADDGCLTPFGSQTPAGRNGRPYADGGCLTPFGSQTPAGRNGRANAAGVSDTLRESDTC